MKKLYYLVAGIAMLLVTIVACEKASIEESELQTLQQKELKAKAAVINVPSDFATIQEAIDDPDVPAGAVIKVANGEYYGAIVTKEVTIKG